MSKKFLAGVSLGLGIPLVAGGVVFGVSTIRNKIIPTEEETETTHTVVLTFKNKQLQTTKLDDEDLTLSRNE